MTETSPAESDSPASTPSGASSTASSTASTESSGDATGSKAGTARRRPAGARRLPLGERLTHPSVAAVLGLGITLWAAWLGLGPFADNSFFTHLATGRLMLENGSVPSADPYSFTAPDSPWLVQSWLASLLYGLVDSWAGGLGLRVLTGVLTGVIGGLVWTLTRPARTLIPRVAICGLVITIGGTMWSPRPLLFGLVFLGLALLAAEGRLDPRWLVPVFWLWVNTHGSFPLGLVAIATLALGRKLDKEDPSIEWRALLWALLGTVLGAVGPLGPQALLFPVTLLSKNDVLQHVLEWQSPNFATGWTRIFLLVVVLAVFGLVRRPTWRNAIPAVVFVSASLLGVRNVAVASIVLAVVLAHELADVGSLRGQDRSPALLAVAGLLVVVFLAASSATLQRPDYALETFPVDAVAWLEQHGVTGRDGARIASQDTTGNYLELLHGADAQVFMDDRVDMYPKDVVDDLVHLINGQGAWREILDRRDADVVLWARDQPLSRLLEESEDWRIVYTDGKWMVACRRGSQVGDLSC